MTAFLLLLAILFVIVVGVEVLSRAVKLPLELTRKATHILTGVTVAVSAFYVGHIYLQILALLFLAVIATSRRVGIFRSIHDPERSGLGDIWYPVGILLATVFFPDPTIFMYSVLILSVSDGLAGLIGKSFGRRKIGFISAPKTHLGFGTFFVTAFALSLLVMPVGPAIGAALYLAVVELLSFRGIDNLILPLAAGILATVVRFG